MPLEALPEIGLGEDQPVWLDLPRHGLEDEPWFAFAPLAVVLPPPPAFATISQVNDILIFRAAGENRRAASKHDAIDPWTGFIITPVQLFAPALETPPDDRIVDVNVAPAHDSETAESWFNLILLPPLGGVSLDYDAGLIPDTSALYVTNMAAATFDAAFDWVNFTPAPPATPPGGIIVYWWGGQEFSGPAGNLNC